MFLAFRPRQDFFDVVEAADQARAEVKRLHGEGLGCRRCRRQQGQARSKGSVDGVFERVAARTHGALQLGGDIGVKG